MAFSNYVDKAVLDHIFGKSVLSSPTVYVALFTADPGKFGIGIGSGEPGGNGYARVITSASDWNIAVDGVGDIGGLNNANTIIFPMSTGNWGTITHFAIFDALTNGHCIAYGALDSPINVSVEGYIVKFLAGDLMVTLD